MDIEKEMYAEFDARVRRSKPRFVQLIQEVTGWNGDELADWMIDLLCTNVGGGPLSPLKPPCHKEHAPMSVPAYTQMLVEVTKKSSNHPSIQTAAAKYAEQLRRQFGL